MATKTPTASSSGGGGIPIHRNKRGFKAYIADLRRELAKVSWPTIAETNRLTLVVLAVCALLVVVLGAMGLFFEFVINFIQGHA